ncbi:MAG: iron-containing alcohol dehydrogenase [Candidatus Scalindua rubra]|uniref:3-dehydroquinate synthase n=1 Tax=Candidatus Scalindua brodae TaxID=237368 RepID=A0A0B0EM13_9BACT|nr:MAG: 3-dehydroquinate synthase [Candidatus Scalindua brodae]MBZ0109656.1 iron-containing alcohol dehydrogenase [Candidatus Scalindua rubra]TWU33089.1 3-dehydroquinate synthase [Candidatus Brocadiaceae bacterium S225]
MSEKFIVKSRLRDYEVCFLEDINSTIEHYANINSFFIIDKRVMDLFGKQISCKLTGERTLIVEAVEQNKTLDYCTGLIQRLITANVRRDNCLIAIGGGIIQDITSFVSTILFRGIEWVFFPTTLLSQSDSCIGSKTSINLNEYKNLLGSFYPPSKVFIDINFLKTLPVGEIKSGIGEILHFYFNDGSRLAREMMDSYDNILKTPSLLEKYIKASLKIKKKIIEIDELDKNERNLFNYGHTFGHAIETISNYSVPHGQAVTLGMDIANFVSLRLGYLDKNVFEDMRKIMSRNLPTFRINEDMIDDYIRALSKDKKNMGNNLGCILTNGPGSMRKEYVPLNDELRDLILAYFRVNT